MRIVLLVISMMLVLFHLASCFAIIKQMRHLKNEWKEFAIAMADYILILIVAIALIIIIW